jgi:hypothetical protein
VKQNDELNNKVKELEAANYQLQQSPSNNKENINGNLRKAIKEKLKPKHIVKSSKGKGLIQKKEYSTYSIENRHGRSNSDISVTKDMHHGAHRRIDSNDTSYLLSALKKGHDRSISESIEEDNSGGSSDEVPNYKHHQVRKEEQYQTMPSRSNNYDLKPYRTETTTQGTYERMQPPIVNNDNSPLLLKTRKAQNFKDFQQHLSSQLGLKRPEDIHQFQRLRQEQHNSIDKLSRKILLIYSF